MESSAKPVQTGQEQVQDPKLVEFPQKREPREKKGPKSAEHGATPSHPGSLPTPNSEGVYDLEGPEYFLNRELTWLNFNFRVLHEAEDTRTPLLERIKFLAIVGSNIDEFFMKRIGGLKQQVGAGVQKMTADGRTPEEQIEACYALVRRLETQQRKVLHSVLKQLKEHDIVVTTFHSLGKRDQAYLCDYYFENIFPLVTPQATDPAHPFPFVSNLSLNLLVGLRHPKETASLLARVKVPIGTGVSRFIKLEDKNTFVTLESVMAGNLDLLFPGMEIDSCEEFRVTRNANTLLDEETADDLLALITGGLRERKFAPVVRLEVDEGISPVHRGRLAAELGLDEQEDVFEVRGMLGPSDLMELTSVKNPELHDAPHHPVNHPIFEDKDSIFHLIRDQGHVMVHHPYDSFTTSVERFLREASVDPKVRAIKMVLYRTSAESRAVNYLIDAARNGKQVAVVVELKARFDEEANIRWANRLEEVGVHVTYGVVGLKTHCKAILVVRQDYDGLRRYAHVGTGNYHSETARLYSDLGMFTCDVSIAKDLTELFNYLTTGYKPKRKYEKVLPAPKVLKQALLSKIEREIEVHTEESPGLIQFKMNALEDVDVTRALYRASQAGVKVDLIIRDSCRLRPGVKGFSENIRVVSIVGRFLEHCRVFYFQNAGQSEYYIGSADCMKRNLESRVEALTPVESDELRQQLRHLIDTQLNDERGAWDMRSDGSYVQRMPADGSSAVHSQAALADWSEDRHKQGTRLRRRKTQGINRMRNVR
ncbi:MAG: polyphosphate kinase 1 [Gemmatimonadota bacterium]|nr:MAG: polyphosphate kinase 1 [Gemmatimonadota bacterium]